MSVTLYPSNFKSLDPTKQRGVEGTENIAAFLGKVGALPAPLMIRGHKDHILAMLQANKDRHVNVTFQENRLHVFCTPAMEPTKRKLRVGGLKTSGVSVAMAVVKLASRAVRGKYMTLYVTDSEHDADAHGQKSRPVEYTRSVTFADLKSIVSPY